MNIKLPNLTMVYNDHIILDDIRTWPDSVKKYLQKRERQLRGYIDEETRIDKLAEKDVLLRVKRPINKYINYWDSANEDIQLLIDKLSTVSFHCTRLTNAEIEDVSNEGLQPASPTFARERIEQTLKRGLISKAVAEALHKDNKSGDTNRIGNVCLFHCLSTLKDEYGLYRLFKYWGGEAIYCAHEKNAAISGVLQNIGVPCIVVASLPVSTVNRACPCRSLSERIVRIWLSRKQPDEHFQELSTFVKHKVNVLQIIKRDDSRFETFTGCSKWRNGV